jgi:putative exosortase-associated protein (TIGR04073 family)
MKFITSLVVVLLSFSFAQADLSMPKKRNFYDQMGEGLANVILAPAELFDSTFDQIMTEGATVGVTKGFVQGTSRMVMDVAVGLAEIASSPFAMQINDSLKSPAYDSGQVELYPSADLVDNWY